MSTHVARNRYLTGRTAWYLCGRRAPTIPLMRDNLGEGAWCRSCARVASAHYRDSVEDTLARWDSEASA